MTSRKCPVGGNGGNPVRRCELDVTPAAHPGRGQGPPLLPSIEPRRGHPGPGGQVSLLQDLQTLTRGREKGAWPAPRSRRMMLRPRLIISLCMCYSVEPRSSEPASALREEPGSHCCGVSDSGPDNCRGAARAGPSSAKIGAALRLIVCVGQGSQPRFLGVDSRHAEDHTGNELRGT